MNADQQRFTAYVLELDKTRVWTAKMKVHEAEFALREAEHRLSMAKAALKTAEEFQQSMQETLG